MAYPASAIRQLAEKLGRLLDALPGINFRPCPPNYSLPEASQFALYLLRLEQMLAVSCSALGSENAMDLNGEREIIDGNLEQCLNMPASVNARILFAKTLLYMKDVRQDVVREYSDRIALLQSEHPLVEPAHGFGQQLFDQAILD